MSRAGGCQRIVGNGDEREAKAHEEEAPHIAVHHNLEQDGEADEAHHAACSGQTGLQPSRDGRSDGLTDGSASDEEQGDDDSEDQAKQSHGEVVQALDALGVRVVSHVIGRGHKRGHKREDQGNAKLAKQSERNGEADCRVGLEAVAIARMAAMMPPMTALGG